MLKCKMNSEFYQEIIDFLFLKFFYLFSFVGKKFNYEAILHQDNDTKHKSKICINALKHYNINWV